MRINLQRLRSFYYEKICDKIDLKKVGIPIMIIMGYLGDDSCNVMEAILDAVETLNCDREAMSDNLNLPTIEDSISHSHLLREKIMSWGEIDEDSAYQIADFWKNYLSEEISYQIWEQIGNDPNAVSEAIRQNLSGNIPLVTIEENEVLKSNDDPSWLLQLKELSPL